MKLENDAERSATPDGGQNHGSQRSSEGEKHEWRIGPGYEDEDHRVVEPPCTQARGGSAPGEAVVERTRPEHRSERDRIDPDGEPLKVSVRQDDEHDARDEGCYERVLMEHAA